jgi:hypothetical protein
MVKKIDGEGRNKKHKQHKLTIICFFNLFAARGTQGMALSCICGQRSAGQNHLE